jgi:VCBS repeat-containing protein
MAVNLGPDIGTHFESPTTFSTNAHVVDMVVHADTPPTAFAEVGDPKRPHGTVAGAVVSRNTGVLGYGPVLFTTAKGGLVSVGALSGRFSYTPSHQARLLALSSADLDDRVDSFTVTVTDLYGGSTDVPVTVEILTADVPPIGAPVLRLPDSAGVVTGYIQGSARDGGTLVYSLANTANPTDSTAESAYSANGGLVRLDTATGEFVFVPTLSTAIIPGLDTDTFTVTVSNTLGGSADVIVNPLAHLKIGVETVSTAPDVQCGRLAVSEDGPLSFGVGVGPRKGTVQVDRNGNYVYTRTPGLGHGITAADSFTITGTDDYGRSITVSKVRVSPPLASAAPVSGTVEVFESAVNGMGDQTTRGMIAAAGAERFITGTVQSIKGSSAKITEDGTFTYSSTQNLGVGHAAAAVDALAADKVDTFSVLAEHRDGRRSPVLVTVPLHPYNNTPTQGTIGGSGRVRGLKTGGWTTSVVDVDGDDITYRIEQRNPAGVVSVGRNRVGAFTVHYESTSARTGTWYPTEVFTITFYDGHLRSDGTPASVTAQYVF